MTIRRSAATAAAAFLAACGEPPDGAGEPLAVPPAAEVPHVALTLPVPQGSGFVDGAVSPDGRTFAYGVASGKHVRVWTASLGTGRARVLTPARGKRVDLAWSPDGSRLAFWDAARGGIWMLHPRSGRERRFRRDPLWSDDFYSGPWWTPSGDLLFRRNFMEGLTVGEETLVMPAGGGGPRPLVLPGEAPPAHPVFSPDERRVAFIAGGCCGGAGVALWVRDVGSGEQRCVAGPLSPSAHLPVWAPDGTEIYLLATPPDEKGVSAAYAARPAEGSGARRLGRDPAVSLSVDRRGDVYVVAGVPGPGRRPLWRYPRASLRAAAGQPEIAGCPPPDAAVMDFVARARLPSVRSVDPVLSDSARGLVVFRVTYGTEMDWGLWESRTGLRVGGRIGWLAADEQSSSPETPSEPRFDLRSDDEYLFSHDFLRRLREHGLEHDWLRFAATHPATPPEYMSAAGQFLQSLGPS